jgi:uncharacterized membrane protein
VAWNSEPDAVCSTSHVFSANDRAAPSFNTGKELPGAAPASSLAARAYSLLFVVSICLFIAARLWRLTTYSLRADEIFSLKAARHGWHGLMSVVIADIVHPPVFYVLLKCWMALGGQSEFWLRLLPVLAAVASTVPFTLLCRELGLARSETSVALLLIAANSYLIYYSQELRMYSLLLLVSLGSLWLFAKFLRSASHRRSLLAALFAVNLLLVYTQYYGWLVVLVELLIVFASRSRERWRFLASVAALAVCFAPWACLVGRVAVQRGGLESNIGSFPRPSFVHDVAGFYQTLSGDYSAGGATFLGLILCGFPIVLWLLSSVRGSEREQNAGSRTVILWRLSAFAFLPVLLSYGFSHLLPQSVWGTRFLIIAAVPYLLLVSVAAFQIPFMPLRAFAVSLIIAWALLSCVQDLRDTGKNAWQPLVYEMRMAESAAQGPVMIYTFDSSDETIQFYLEEAHDNRFRTSRISSVAQLQGGHFWVALRTSPNELTKAGFVVGPGLRDGFGVTLLPAWRK